MPELAPIELYTAETRIVGWIEANGLRVTDLLNAHDELRLWRPSPGPLDGALTEAANGVEPDPADPTAAPVSGRRWPPTRSCWPCLLSGAPAGSCGCIGAC